MIIQEITEQGYLKTYSSTGRPIVNQFGNIFISALDNPIWGLVYAEYPEIDDFELSTMDNEGRENWIKVVTENNKIDREINELIKELSATDYIAIKNSEGIDCSKYGNWKEDRQAIRDKIAELEVQKKSWY